MDKIIIEGDKGRIFEIALEDQLQRRYEMVRELSLSSKRRDDVCSKYGYTRKTGNEYLNAWKEKSWEGLKDKPRGTKSKRTDEIEKRILEIRFKDQEKDMYDIAALLRGEGYEISDRSVARVLSEHGVTLKKKKKKPSTKYPKTKTKKKIQNLNHS